MTAEGILTEDELPFDSEMGRKLTRAFRCEETYKYYQARENQVIDAQRRKERRIFGDGARVALRLDPVLFHKIANDPRFGADCFGEAEFEKDMAKWHPEFCVKSKHVRGHYALGEIDRASKPDKDAKYLVA